MNIAALIALALPLGYACFYQGSYFPDDRYRCAAAVGTIAAAYFLIPRRDRVAPMARLLAVCASVALGVAAFQLAPFPAEVLRILSPARAELLRALAQVPGGAPRYATISVQPHATADMVLTAAMYLVVFLMVRDLTLRLRDHPWSVAWPLLIVAVLEGLLGFLQSRGAGGLAAWPQRTTIRTITRACWKWPSRFRS